MLVGAITGNYCSPSVRTPLPFGVVRSGTVTFLPFGVTVHRDLCQAFGSPATVTYSCFAWRFKRAR